MTIQESRSPKHAASLRLQCSYFLRDYQYSLIEGQEAYCQRQAVALQNLEFS